MANFSLPFPRNNNPVRTMATLHRFPAGKTPNGSGKSAAKKLNKYRRKISSSNFKYERSFHFGSAQNEPVAIAKVPIKSRQM